MDMRWLILMAVVIIFLTACAEKGDLPAQKLSGLKISEATHNEKNEVIHNIVNFDNFTHIVNVTTLCFDGSGNIIDDSDSYVMEILPDVVQGWRPNCPQFTANYRISIKEMAS